MGSTMGRIPRVILLIETSRQFGRGLLQGIGEFTRLYGPWTVYREPGGLPTRPPDMRRWRADGIIVRGEGIEPEEIMEMGLAAVFSLRRIEQVHGAPCIQVDAVAAGRLGAEHFLERGFKHFGFCGFSDLYWSVERRTGFSARLAEAGFEAHLYERPEAVLPHSWSEEQASLVKWLKSLPKPVGILACSDYRGQHVIEGCRVAGLPVPEQVAVVGVCNDEIMCNLCDPPLSSIVLTVEKAGYEAARVLDQMMAGQTVPANTIVKVEPTHVITRQSTDVLAIDDRDVAEAVRFIREHCRDPIQVADVVAATSVSRRALEQRFRKTMGHSINREIRRVRVGWVARILVETNRTVAQIAMDLGYPGIDHIARYFRAEKGISPVAYRRRHQSG